MAPKKPSAKASAPTAADFKIGDIVLTKVKGYPEWPGKIIEASSSPENIQKLKAGRPILVRFYPDGDYVWAYPKELRQLTAKIIDAYLSDESKKKQGKLRQGYEIAKDPSEWEAEQAKKDAAAQAVADEPEEDVDMLAEDGAAGGAAGKKRKRAAGDKEPKAKKEAAPKAKKEPAPKKRKTDEKPKSSKPAKDAKEKSGSAAAAPEEDGSEEEKTVKNWRALLQRAFLTKGFPEADQMPKYDATFKEMENFTMQPQWLASSKLGKVLKKMAALTEEIPREAEFKIKERANALMERWKGMLNKDTTSAPAASGDTAPAATATTAPEDNNAGDLTVMQEDEKKEPQATEEAKKAEEKPAADAAAAPAAETDAAAAPSTNGEKEGVNAEGQTNGAEEVAKPAEETKKDAPAAEEKKEEAPAASEEVKENGADATPAAA